MPTEQTQALSTAPPEGPSGRRRPRLTWLVLLAVFIATQAFLAFAAPLSLVHRYRMPYEIIKDDLRNIDLAMATLRNHVRLHSIEEYVIILGDSVGYSGPGGPEQSLSRYLGDLTSSPPNGLAVFNLSIPGAQIGDIYVLMLKLAEHKLEPAWLIVNLTYAGFAARQPDPPPVFWLRDELARLDHAADLVTAPAYPPEPRTLTAADRAEAAIIECAQRWLPVLAYRDYLRAMLLGPASGLAAAEQQSPTPWYEKPWLDSYLRQPEYLRGYDPAPLVMDDSNPNVYFLRRIVDRAPAGTRLLLVNSPVNPALLADLQSAPGYVANMRSIDLLVATLVDTGPLTHYVNLATAVPDRLFHDHLHLLPDGYAYLAALLWQEMTEAR